MRKGSHAHLCRLHASIYVCRCVCVEAECADMCVFIGCIQVSSFFPLATPSKCLPWMRVPSRSVRRASNRRRRCRVRSSPFRGLPPLSFALLLSALLSGLEHQDGEVSDFADAAPGEKRENRDQDDDHDADHHVLARHHLLGVCYFIFSPFGSSLVMRLVRLVWLAGRAVLVSGSLVGKDAAILR
ncbi:hypothetical protein GGS23DRAFT_373997 [Durotheca rogersii]|uniref:uncharacterized protein n=1 Tax=Durotheca rogersii TaxID=419775 RepID=UPI0022208FCA|nr:uncharacterized protein GGS23DRAFT_373997 [Durotheca rogersii]KAI5866197.1 hypothetical protein GGS23DRAFT_373997 [Durotheca rogersii]